MSEREEFDRWWGSFVVLIETPQAVFTNTDSMEDAEIALAAWQAATAASDTRYQARIDEIDALRAECNRLTGECALLAQERNKVDEEIESLQAKLAMFSAEIRDLQTVKVVNGSWVTYPNQVRVGKLLNATKADVDAFMSKKKAEIKAPLQAKIDALMLEYCPDEMTDEQIEAWGMSQERGGV